jgi:hypothetical protein
MNNNRPAKRRRLNKNNNSNNNSTWNKLAEIYASVRAGNAHKLSTADLLMYLIMHPTPEMRAGGRKLYTKNGIRVSNGKPATRNRLMNNIRMFG